MPDVRTRKPKAVVDVPTMLDSSVVEYIASLVAGGVLVSIGRTRDGGALSIGILCGDEREREYFRDPVELAEWLRDAETFYVPGAAVPPTTRKASRTG